MVRFLLSLVKTSRSVLFPPLPGQNHIPLFRAGILRAVRERAPLTIPYTPTAPIRPMDDAIVSICSKMFRLTVMIADDACHPSPP